MGNQRTLTGSSSDTIHPGSMQSSLAHLIHTAIVPIDVLLNFRVASSLGKKSCKRRGMKLSRKMQRALFFQRTQYVGASCTKLRNQSTENKDKRQRGVATFKN